MKQNLAVIVGTGIGGQREVKEALDEQGFEVKTTGVMWPQDHYVYFDGRYVRRRVADKFGEGGYFRIGNDFLLVSDFIYETYQVGELRHIHRDIPYDKMKEIIAAECKKYHLTARVHVAPSGYYHKGKGRDSHLDTFTLLLPNRKILIVDTHFGNKASTTKEYDEIARIEKLELIRYDGSQDGVWNPLNASVLPGEDNQDVVFVDDKSKSLIRLLEENGVKAVGVEMPQHEYPAGKINCMVNVYNPEEITMEDLLIGV
jgi:hypothetical protein